MTKDEVLKYLRETKITDPFEVEIGIDDWWLQDNTDADNAEVIRALLDVYYREPEVTDLDEWEMRAEAVRELDTDLAFYEGAVAAAKEATTVGD